MTQEPGLEQAIAAAAAINPGSRVSSYFSTHDRSYVSADGHTIFAEIYPPGTPGFTSTVHIDEVRAALTSATPDGVTASFSRPRPDLRRLVGRRRRGRAS